MSRYHFAPLAALMGLSEHQACQLLRVSGSTAQQYRRDGLSEQVADRLAVRAGFHPAEVWPHWWDQEEDAERRAKVAERQRRYRQNPLVMAKKRAADRAYYEDCRQTLLLAERTRYWTDPDKQRERKRRARATESTACADVLSTPENVDPHGKTQRCSPVGPHGLCAKVSA